MGHPAITIARPNLVVIEGGRPGHALSAWTPTREMLFLGGIMVVLQVCDGVLTAVGMNAFGLKAEGNLLLRMLMEQIGWLPALLAAKCAAISIVAALCLLSARVLWVSRALKIMIAVYFFAAIVPWSAIILLRVS